MKERRYVRFRVDMYEDTKFKIIDKKPERDLIHYVWTRIVALAGKVNLEGDLYLSRNIPYTLETLAIEFNRGVEQIKLSLDTFLELEMLEFKDNKIYRVTNFSKHQNIKTKEKNDSNKNSIAAKEPQLPQKDESVINAAKKTNLEKELNAFKDSKNAPVKNKIINLNNNDTTTLEENSDSVNNSGSDLINSNTDNKNTINITNPNNINSINNNNISPTSSSNSKPLEIRTNKSIKKKGISSDIMSIDEDSSSSKILDGFTEGGITLEKSDRILRQWSLK